MSDVYIKDDGKECELCKETSGYCHIHSKDAESDDSRFSPTDYPDHCLGCESPITVHSASFYTQRHNPNRANVMLVLQCDCTETEIPNGVNTVSADTLPKEWV